MANKATLNQWMSKSLPYTNIEISLSSIPQSSLTNRTSDFQIVAPNLTYLSTSCFVSSTGLQNIYAPKATGMGNTCFSGCTGLTVLVFDSLARSDSQAFGNCSNITTIEFGGFAPRSILGSTFLNCSKLKTLILRAPGVIALNDINAFSGSPFASGKTGGTLYVPQKIIQYYQSATNWSTILGYTNNQILPIEESIYEFKHADGRDYTPPVLRNNLPDLYQEVDYISAAPTATGTGPIIVTDIDLYGTTIQIDAEIYPTAKKTWAQVICGTKKINNEVSVDIYIPTAATSYQGFCGSDLNIAPNGSGVSILNKKVTVSYKILSDSHEITVNDGINTVNNSDNNITPRTRDSNKFTVFGLKNSDDNANPNTLSYLYYGRIYKIDVYIDGVQKLHLLPCFRRTDLVIGMYDTINDQFYTSFNSNTFSKGGVV